MYKNFTFLASILCLALNYDNHYADIIFLNFVGRDFLANLPKITSFVDSNEKKPKVKIKSVKYLTRSPFKQTQNKLESLFLNKIFLTFIFF